MGEFVKATLFAQLSGKQEDADRALSAARALAGNDGVIKFPTQQFRPFSVNEVQGINLVYNGENQTPEDAVRNLANAFAKAGVRTQAPAVQQQQQQSNSVTPAPAVDAPSQQKSPAAIVIAAAAAVKEGKPVEVQGLPMKDGLYVLPKGEYNTGQLDANAKPLKIKIGDDTALDADSMKKFIANELKGLAPQKRAEATAPEEPVKVTAAPVKDLPKFVNANGKGNPKVADVQAILENIGFATDTGGAKDNKVDGIAGKMMHAAVMKAEQTLIAAGKLDGKADGKIDDKFIAALKEAQKDPELLTKLAAVANGGNTMVAQNVPNASRKGQSNERA
jgi:hypothetical protein